MATRRARGTAKREYRATDALDAAVTGDILAALDANGVTTELAVSREFTGSDWHVWMRPNFFDKDDGKSREYDLRICTPDRQDKADDERMAVTSVDLAAEVKVSRRTPWVVLSPARNVVSPPSPWHPILTGSLSQPLADALHPMLSVRGHPLFRPQNDFWSVRTPLDVGVVEPLKPAAEQDTWFRACVSACKAAEHLAQSRRMEDALMGRLEGEGAHRWRVVRFVKPVVVVDTLLVALKHNADDSFRLEKIDAAQVEFEFSTAHYTRNRYRVDLVTLPGLRVYGAVVLHLADALHSHNLAVGVQPPREGRIGS